MFYDGSIKDDASVEKRMIWHEKELFSPTGFIDVPFSMEEDDTQTLSKRNRMESKIVVGLLQEFNAYLESNRSRGIKVVTVGIIAGYRAQLELLKTGLSTIATPDDRNSNRYRMSIVDVDLKSVDGYQGQERDVIIFSAVRANKEKKLGFLEDSRRLNVAATRARYSFWVVGNKSTLSAYPEWRELINMFPSHNASKSDILNRYYEIKAGIENMAQTDARDLEAPLIIDPNSPWKLALTKTAVDTLKHFEFSRRRVLINQLGKLTQGLFGKAKKLAGRSIAPKLVKYSINDMTIVWSLGLCSQQEYYEQIISVWFFSESSNVDRLFSIAQGQFASYSDRYLELCHIQADFNAILPVKHYKINVGVIQFTKTKEDAPELAQIEEDVGPIAAIDVINMKKCHTLEAIDLMNLIDENIKNIDYAFDMTEEQLEIMKYEDSMFIIGRSGTGKVWILNASISSNL